MAQTIKQQIGQLGEDISVKHFVKHNFDILDRNYRKPWGEIDVIAKKDDIIHFIEVKTVTHETSNQFSEYQPEENVHFWKGKRFMRIIETYLAEKNVSYETEWQIDVVAVFLDPNTKEAKIRITENVLL